MSYKFDYERRKQKFTDKEKPIISKLKKKGWEFDWEEAVTYHTNTSDGWMIKFKSPKMTSWDLLIMSNVREVTLDELIMREANQVTAEILDNLKYELQAWFGQTIITPFLKTHPRITAKQLNNLKLSVFLDESQM